MSKTRINIRDHTDTAWEVRLNKFKSLMSACYSPAEISAMICWLDHMNYFHAPASSTHHSNYSGGLFDHSLCVTTQLLRLTDQLHLTWEEKRSPYIIGMFHDLCKCDNYKTKKPNADKDTNEAWEYNNATLLPGHGDKSVIMLTSFMTLTLEEIMCIRWHMGAFDDKENWNSYGQAVTQFPNVLYTHTADMIAARILGV